MNVRMSLFLITLLAALALFAGCGNSDDSDTDTADGDATDGDSEDGDAEDGDVDGDTEDGDSDGDEDGDEDTIPPKQTGIDPPPQPSGELGYTRPAREQSGTAPTAEEITSFTKNVTGFFKDTKYFDWLYRTTHGLDASYDPEMMDYKLWWQDTGMRRDGDTVTFFHHGRAENITKRTIKVLNNTLALHLLTGEARYAELAGQLMRGIVAQSIGTEFEREDPLVKYIQARAIFNHNHGYQVDGREMYVDYDEAKVASFKWNVHVFNIPDNPMYGDIWVSNMRSKDDVPYMFFTLPLATRAYYETENPELKEAIALYIEYLRGFAQSIVDNDWFILTKYEDGVTTIAIDATIEGNPPADLGSFVHWREVFGPDAECNAQLGAAMTAYGFPADRGDCGSGKIGWDFEMLAAGTHFFNYNIYTYFHIAAMATAQLWGFNDIAQALMDGLVFRFDELMHNPDMPNNDDNEFPSDLAGWLLQAATHGYPLSAEEAKHIMKWYGDSAVWYRQWPHWDPWASLEDGEELRSYKPIRDQVIDAGTENEQRITMMRAVEMPYIFEYCYSPLRDKEGVQFIDCDIVADPDSWGE